MDRKIFEKFGWLGRKTMVLGGVLIAIAVSGAYLGKAYTSKPAHGTGDMNIVAQSVKDAFKFSELTSTYAIAWQNVQNKVDELQVADEQRKKLQLENAQLKLDLESARFSCQQERAHDATQKLTLKLSQETGSKVGRTIASIPYVVPSNLLPQQLFTLAMAYFKDRQDEKAAVLLTFLTGLEDVMTYKNPASHLMTGISWYRLDNFELADFYFDKVLSSPEQPENLRYHAQARLWKGVASARVGKHTKAQYWLRELMDYHPHSKEVTWVNNREVRRATASVHSADESQ